MEYSMVRLRVKEIAKSKGFNMSSLLALLMSHLTRSSGAGKIRI